MANQLLIPGGSPQPEGSIDMDTPKSAYPCHLYFSADPKDHRICHSADEFEQARKEGAETTPAAFGYAETAEKEPAEKAEGAAPDAEQKTEQAEPAAAPAAAPKATKKAAKK